MLGRLAIAWDIKRVLRETEDLLAFQKLLFGRVVQFGIRGTLALLLCARGHAENDHDRKRK
jgi:hypothetical protein